MEDGTPTARTGKILSSTPMGRFVKPEELNGALEFLADDEKSSAVTGVVIPVDCGFGNYSEFNMKDRYIVCIDSDGCVMDTMNFKHKLCFIHWRTKMWNVKNKERFLQIWNNVNLFSETRGINRFKGLYLTFDILSKDDSVNL